MHPIGAPSQIKDPLDRQSSPLKSTLKMGRLVGLAVLIHFGIILLLSFATQFLEKHQSVKKSERIQIQVYERPKPPPPPPPEPEKKLEVVEKEIQPDFAPKKPEVQAPPPKPKPKPKPKKRKRKKATPKVEKKEPPKSKTPPPIRRIVGLSMESTAQGGSGPSFAVGTSRMGETAKRAVDPKRASKEPKQDKSETLPISDTREQRTAAHIPTRDVAFTKPKRLKPSKAPYPAVLKAQGIEGDVLVRVSLDKSGKVSSVKIVKGSGQKTFDEAARKAAFAEKFSPARRNGKAIPFTLSYHYRFRIEDD